MTHVDDVSRHGGSGSHRWAHQVGAASSSLPPFQITVAGGGAALAGVQAIGIHAQAHGASGLTPLKTRFGENPVQTLAFSRMFDLLRSRYHHALYVGAAISLVGAFLAVATVRQVRHEHAPRGAEPAIGA